jgi:hypothetical protein
LALFNDWQPSREVDLSARLFVAQFSVSDLSVEIQSQVAIRQGSSVTVCHVRFHQEGTSSGFIRDGSSCQVPSGRDIVWVH